MSSLLVAVVVDFAVGCQEENCNLFVVAVVVVAYFLVFSKLLLLLLFMLILLLSLRMVF